MTEGLLLALAVFLLRILNNAISTLRVVFIARQRISISTVLAFFESLIFAFTVANVVNDLSNWVMLTAYSGGFAIGSYVGMMLERHFVKSFMSINVIVKEAQGRQLALALREADFGVTETLGEGREGMVTMLRSIVDRRDVNELIAKIREVNPDAFIAIEEARAIRSGYFRAAHGRPR